MNIEHNASGDALTPGAVSEESEVAAGLATARVAQCWGILTLAALNRQVLTDKTVGGLTGVPPLAINQLLEPIESYCLANELPPLTALVVSVQTGLPSLGFVLAAEVPGIQSTVFAYDWLGRGASSLQGLAPGVSEDPPQTRRGAGAIDRLRDIGSKATDVTSHARTRVIEQYWPAIERACRERIGPAALEAVRNDDKVADLARAVYPVLPAAVRFVVGEGDFVNFCLANRTRFLAVFVDDKDTGPA